MFGLMLFRTEAVGFGVADAGTARAIETEESLAADISAEGRMAMMTEFA
jgi:hypothetical protein